MGGKALKKNKVSKYAAWLLPGLQVKRWVILTFIGSIFLIIGFLFLFNLSPISEIVSFLKTTASLISQELFFKRVMP